METKYADTALIAAILTNATFTQMLLNENRNTPMTFEATREVVTGCWDGFSEYISKD